MIRGLIFLIVVFMLATFPATWLLMLFLGNVGVSVSYWGALPLGILVSGLLSSSGSAFGASARDASTNGGIVSDGPAKPEGRRLSGGAIAVIVGAVVLLVFIVQNTEDVRFDFLFLGFTWPMWLYTFVVAAFGGLLWFGVEVMRRHRDDAAPD